MSPTYRNIECRPSGGPGEPFEPFSIGSIGPPSCPLFLQCFSRDAQTKASEFQREKSASLLGHGAVSCDKGGERTREGWQLHREISYEIMGPHSREIRVAFCSSSSHQFACHPSCSPATRGRIINLRRTGIACYYPMVTRLRDYTYTRKEKIANRSGQL